MRDEPIWPDDEVPRQPPRPAPGAWGPPPPPLHGPIQPQPTVYPPPYGAPPAHPYPQRPPPYQEPKPEVPWGEPRREEYFPQQGNRQSRPPRWDVPEPRYEPPTHYEPPHTERPPRERRRVQIGWSLPIEHIVLGVGVAAIFFSLSQPWGTDAQGHAIMLNGLAARAATYIVGANAVLGGLLILLNKRMGCLAFSGCLTLFLIPLLFAAAVGGFQVFTQLHVIPQVSLANIKATNSGFYLWWGGLVAIVAGLFLQVVTHRRKGLIGI